MALHVFLFLLVFFLILSLALLWRLCWLPLQPSPSQAGSRRRMVHRLLKPRTPLDCPICQLQLPYLQLDELRTRLRSHTHVLWLWLAIDPRTKILPVLHLGPRTQNAAHTVIHALRRILAPGCLPLFTSDGLNLYFYAALGPFRTLARRTSSRKDSK